jgi:hypothetical protein
LLVVAALAVPFGANATILSFTSSLNGAQETPPNASPATGGALLTFDTSTGLFDLFLSGENLTATLINAHIHSGAPGVPGPVIFDLHADQFFFSPTAFARVINDAVFPAANVADLLANNTYINVHTEGQFAGGEIRGQLTHVQAVPVPEAETWSLMLAGVGLMLAAARRLRRT